MFRRLLDLMATDSEDFRLDLLKFITTFPIYFRGVRCRIVDLERAFGPTELHDGTERDGRSRTAIKHHVGVLVERGLLGKDGSTVWVTEKGQRVAALGL